jgi:hypothetical protein
MLNSGRKFCALPDKKKYILTRVVRKKNSLKIKSTKSTQQLSKSHIISLFNRNRKCLNKLFKAYLGTDHLTCRVGLWFLFRSKKNFRTTRVRLYCNQHDMY